MDFVSRVMSYYRKEKELPPAISSSAAAGISIIFTLIYVLPFYLSSTTRPSPNLTRDAPSVIRARVRAVTFSSILTSLLATWLATNKGHFSIRESLHLLGYWPINLIDLVKTFILVAILFAGPVFEATVCEGQWRDWLRLRNVASTLSTPMGWRNFVAGPITEEVVFRSVIISINLLAKQSPTKLVFLTPLYFGIAHVHHFYEFSITHPNIPLSVLCLRTLLQFTYTSLFGFYAAFVYLRTGSVLAAIVAHSFCNFMGLPRFWGRVEAPVLMGPEDVIRKEDAARSDSGAGIEVADGRLGLQWTVAYYVILALGAWGFYKNLWTLSESKNALVGFL